MLLHPISIFTINSLKHQKLENMKLSCLANIVIINVPSPEYRQVKQVRSIVIDREVQIDFHAS